MELPEFHAFGKQIDGNLAGKIIERVIANSSPRKWAWFRGDPASYNDRLSGKKIRGAVGLDSHIDITIDDSCLCITPPLCYHDDGKGIPKKHQLLLEFSDGSAVSSAIQLWGSYCLYDDKDEGGEDSLRENDWKPSPLTEGFTKSYFEGIMKEEGAQKTSVKGLLATGQRIPGLGNGVLQDIIWTARLHPRLAVTEMTSGEVDSLYASIRDVLGKMVRQGGRDTEKDIFGNYGGYSTILSKKTLGDPCPGCGGKIERRSYLGGNVYFCPECQRL